MSMWKHDYDTIHIVYNYINSYFIFCFWALCFCICSDPLFIRASISRHHIDI